MLRSIRGTRDFCVLACERAVHTVNDNDTNQSTTWCSQHFPKGAAVEFFACLGLYSSAFGSPVINKEVEMVYCLHSCLKADTFNVLASITK